MKNVSLLKMNIRSWIRRDRGSALISAMLIGTVSSIWLAAIYGSIITVFQTHTSAKLKNTLRNGAETALEWGITQMNANAATGATPEIDASEGSYSKTTVPANALSQVAPGIVINGRVYVDNIPAPGPDIPTPPAATGYSYLYDPHLVAGAAGIDRNHWRVLTAISELGAMPNKRAGVRVILKPIFTVSQETVPSVPSTTSSPSHMLTANSIGFSGAGSITGDVHSNGDLNLTGSNTVNGNITTTGNFNITGSGKINGLVSSLGDIKLQSQVNGPVTALGKITTSGSSTINGGLHAGQDMNLSASMNVTGNVLTNGKLTTSGSFTMSTGNIMATTGVNGSSGSFGLTGGNLITLGDFNTGWGSINATNASNGKAYYGGSNQSPAYSPGAAMSTSTPQRAFGGLKATDATYIEANAQLQDALTLAAEQAKAVPMPPAPDRPAGAVQLAANALTKSGSNNVTLNAGDYYINGPIDFSGSNNLQVNGKVRIWLEGSNAYVKFSGSNNINRNDTDPKNQLEVYTNSTKPIQFSGATNVAIGYIYAPNAKVEMSGANTAGVGGIVANNITFSGASGLTRSGNTNPWDVTTTTTTDAPAYAYTFQNRWQVVSWQELSAAEIATYVNR